jgi:DNA helicase-2/ATP-dependent DNA helicase PcrA
MINWNDFENAVVSHLDRDIRRNRDPDQHDCIRAQLDQSLFIAAGPGSGKSTVIALRVLKLIFVDNIDPLNILVTTFTRKAAAELRSRILGWGDQLRQVFIAQPTYSHLVSQLEKLNLNNITTGTLDSIAEEILGEYRQPGTPPPVVIESFVSNALMTRVGLLDHGRHNDQDLKDYVVDLRGSRWGLGLSEISATLLEVKDRFYHDQIDRTRFVNASNHQAVPTVSDAIHDYEQELQDRLFFDFARLEQEFLNQLMSGGLTRFLERIKFVLVDEYQDTNLLQEQIYFYMARAALENEGSITIVGDDDQSLYRFRGATVDLFQAFQRRINSQLSINPRSAYLSRNYRSTPVIVGFCNGFITLDTQYQTARVQNKPPITPMRNQPYTDYPVLGMFRNDVNTLATDLTQFIHRVIHGGGWQFRDNNGNQYVIRIDPQGGSSADVALLFSSPREFDASGDPRLPRLLRGELDQLSPRIKVFNPRGQNLEAIPEVQELCGLILECIDPINGVQDRTNLPQVVADVFDGWRMRAVSQINSNPRPRNPRSLRRFVDSWQRRAPLGGRTWQKREVPLIDLVYKLITWIPIMQGDIEGLVYLEAITRTINQASLFGNFAGQIIVDPGNRRLEDASIREALRNIFAPLATGVIEIDEDLLETLPSDRVNIMSIHQSKGLEFPLVIVDVGSEFRTNHWKQAFKRFPRLNSSGRVDTLKCINLEDELRQFSQMGAPARLPLDRAFDDLTRLYFEAYSRAKDTLVLVGLNSVRDEIPNVATGWDRDGNWHWGRGLRNLVHI